MLTLIIFLPKNKKYVLLFLDLLVFLDYLLVGAGTNTPNGKMNNNQPYKRQYRQLDDDVKQKISDSTRNRPKSEEHKEHIRQGMIHYWQGVPDRPAEPDTL